MSLLKALATANKMHLESPTERLHDTGLKFAYKRRVFASQGIELPSSDAVYSHRCFTQRSKASLLSQIKTSVTKDASWANSKYTAHALLLLLLLLSIHCISARQTV